MKATRLRTNVAQRAIIAPELSRYLDRSQLDLALTDQVQALQVRVRRGLEVFEARLTDARQSVRRALRWWVMGLFACALVVAQTIRIIATSEELDAGAWAVLVVFGVVTISIVPAVRRSALDYAQLSAWHGRFTMEAVDQATTSQDVLAVADEVLETAHALGAIPPAVESE